MGQCFSAEMEVACENSANLEQETKTTKVITYHLGSNATMNPNTGWRRVLQQ